MKIIVLDDNNIFHETNIYIVYHIIISTLKSEMWKKIAICKSTPQVFSMLL